MKYKCTKKYPKLYIFVYSFLFNFQIFLIKRAGLNTLADRF